jgi:DNA repair protein RadC
MRVNQYKTVLDKETRISLLVKEHGFNYNMKGLLNSPDTIYRFMEDNYQMSSMTEEQVFLLTLDTKCNLIGVFKISEGSVNSSIVDTRGLFIKALLANSVNLVLIHNHPSGDTAASAEDLRVTKRVKEAGDIIGINLLDHIIIGNSYKSLKEQGII